MEANLQKLENVRTTILSLLLARKGGSTLRQLNNDYCDIEGTYIPWKDFGYISLLHFLQNMSKHVQIEHINNTVILKGIPTGKSQHVSKLVAGQKSQTNIVGRKVFNPSPYYPMTAVPKFCIPANILLRLIGLINDHPDGISKDDVFQEVQSRIPFANIQMQDMEEQFRELSHKIYFKNNKIYPVQSKYRTSDHLKKTNGMSSSRHESDQRSPIVTASGEEDSNDLLDYYDDDDFTFHDELHNKKATTNIKPTSNFIKETVSKYQDQAMKSTSKVQYEHNNSYYLHDQDLDNDVQFRMECNNNAEKKRRDSLEGENGEILINERVKFRLEKLIQNHPNGIWCAELPELYLEEYKISLNYTELGFNSVREFASQLPEIFHCVQPQGAGDFMLYDAKREIPSKRLKETCKLNILAQLHQIYDPKEEDALPETVSLDICKELIPDDTMNIGESVGHVSVSDLTQNEKPYIEVLVVEVFTPSFFWIQLRRKQKTFKKFMDQLHNFYVEKWEEYVVPPLVLEKGLNCACIYNGIWHRGIIKTVKPDLQVTVMFYDYGTLKTYPPEAIHYLHRTFSSLPAQAIPCGLVNTRPYKASKWTRSATHHFAMRTQMPLIATIASVNTEDNSMMVTLTDTTEDEDVHINDWLVEQKLAEHGKMGDKVDMSKLLLYIEENLVFSPEQCYESESSVLDKSSNESTEKSNNGPLVLPQSTLEDTYFKTTQELTASEKYQNLSSVTEENMPDQVSQSNSVPVNNTDTSIKNCTNPFLQDTVVHNEIDRTPKRFMELWNENLRLQMEITATLKILFNKVLNSTVKSGSDNLMKNVNMSNTCLPAGDNILSTNCTDINSSSANICNENRNLNIYSDSCQNANIQDGSSNTHKQATTNIRPPRGYENYNRMKFDEQYAANYTNAELSTSDNYLSSNTVLRETNPFKLSLAGKMRIDSEEDNNLSNSVSLASALYENQKLISDHDLNVRRFLERSNSNMKTQTPKIAENAHRDTLLYHFKHYLNNTGNNTNNIKNESFVSNAKSVPPGYNWNVQIDDVTNAMAEMAITNQGMQHAARNIQEMKHRTEQYLHSFYKPDRQECVAQGKNNLSLESRFLSTNNLASTPMVINNTNYDERSFAYPSASQNVYTSSPLLQVHNKTERFQQLLNENANKTADMWGKSFQNIAQLNDWNKAAFLPEKNEQTMIYPKSELNHSIQNSDTGGVAESLVNIDNASAQNSSSRGNQLQNTVTCTTDYVIYFQVIDLPNGAVHLLHYQGEGWLLTDEFIQTFTKLESTSYALIFFYTHNIRVKCQKIDRANDLIRFINIGRVLSKTTHERIYSKNTVHLTQLQSVIEILDKLQIIAKEDINNVLVSGSTGRDIWLIDKAYKHLKHCIVNAE